MLIQFAKTKKKINFPSKPHPINQITQNKISEKNISTEELLTKSPFKDETIISNNSTHLQQVVSFQNILTTKPRSPQKVSSLSLIKEKYIQSSFVATIKSSENKENEDGKNRNFEEFSIIKNEEGISFSENENPNLDYDTRGVNSNKVPPVIENENAELNNTHLKKLNNRLDECLSKGRSHSPSLSPSDRSYDQKNPGNISYRSKSLKGSQEINQIYFSNSIKLAEKSAEKLKIKKIIYDNGEYYEGEVLGEDRHGYGTLYNKSNKIIYQGEWETNLYNGHGIRYNPIITLNDYKEGFPYGDFNKLRGFWVKYEGGFLKGKKNGSGVLMLSNNEYFQGMFCEDKIHGKGSFQMINGKRVIGEWNNNKLIHKIN